MDEEKKAPRAQAGTILIVAAIIGLVIFAAPIIPISYNEPYQIQVSYTVQVPYTVEVEVIKTKTVIDHTISLGLVIWEKQDFMMTSTRNVKISWYSSEEIILFSVIKESTYDSLYWALISNLGLAVVTTIISGGTLAPAVIASLPPLILASLQSVASGDYYKISDSSDTSLMNLEEGLYKIVVIDFDSSGTLNAKITYDYETIETQTKYRDETRYRTETKYREVHETVTIWNYITKYG